MSRSLLFILLLLGSPALAEDFEIVRYPLALSFPKDHGSHPQHKTEWWYFTGHLSANDRGDVRRFGFELTFFRVGIKGGDDLRVEKSKWSTSNIFLAHFALSDDLEKKFYFSERISRESFSLAGAAETNLKVWLRDWKAELNDQSIRLQATAPEFSINLNFKSEKPPVLNGRDGYSKKGPADDEASLYSSLTRLIGSGSIRVIEREFQIHSAEAWMDHEAFTSKEIKGAKKWDWFAIQLDSNEEIMAYLLRDEAGVPTEFSSGTFVDAKGNYHPLQKDDFEVTDLSSWKSPISGKIYPSTWRIVLKERGVDLKVAPTILDQEIRSQDSTGVVYWEGRCAVSGSHSGNAYVELVGR